MATTTDKRSQQEEPDIEIEASAMRLLDRASDELGELLYEWAGRVAATRRDSPSAPTHITSQDVQRAIRALRQAITSGQITDAELTGAIEEELKQWQERMTADSQDE